MLQYGNNNYFHMNYLLLFLPWILLIVLNFLILPVALYISGKLLKIDHPKFTFGACYWIVFVAGLIGGLLSSINIYLSLAVYFIYLGYMLNKQFQLGPRLLVLLISIMLAFTLLFNYAQVYIVNSLLISQFATGGQIDRITGPESEDGKVACSILSVENASEVFNMKLESRAGKTNCVYREGYKKVFTINYIPIEDAGYYEKDSLENMVFPDYEIEKELDDILAGAFIVRGSMGNVIDDVETATRFMVFKKGGNTYQVTDGIEDITIEQFEMILSAVVENSEESAIKESMATSEVRTQAVPRVRR